MPCLGTRWHTKRAAPETGTAFLASILNVIPLLHLFNPALVHTGEGAALRILQIVADDVMVCPVCKATKFVPINDSAEIKFACVHEVGVAKGLDEEVVSGLRANFEGECTEVGMYLAMARVAEREGYPEVAEAYKRYAYEEAEHASKFAELLGECVTDSTKKNLELRVAAETGACAGKLAIAKRAKELGYDAIHDTVHEMAKDEARHGAGFNGLLNRYFKK